MGPECKCRMSCWRRLCKPCGGLHQLRRPRLLRSAQGKLAARNSRGGRQSRYCLRLELVQRQTVMHYQAARSRSFLRIVVATPNLVAQARGAPRRHANHHYPPCCIYSRV